MTKEQECMKALQCLYLEVPSVIADDIKQKVIDALNEVKNCNIPHVSPRYYYVATKVNKNEIRLISGGFSKNDAIEYKQFIIQKYPTAFIIADFNEG